MFPARRTGGRDGLFPLCPGHVSQRRPGLSIFSVCSAVQRRCCDMLGGWVGMCQSGGAVVLGEDALSRGVLSVRVEAAWSALPLQASAALLLSQHGGSPLLSLPRLSCWQTSPPHLALHLQAGASIHAAFSSALAWRCATAAAPPLLRRRCAVRALTPLPHLCFDICLLSP